MKSFYEPTKEFLALSGVPWSASYSGGKDSTALVTVIEYYRRSGWLDAPLPKLVNSDTGIEDAALTAIAGNLMETLRKCGWECAVVEPLVKERLYNRILGVGVTPIHPGKRKMRWCTRSTKIDPMNRWRKANVGGLVLTGRRLGESARRDESIKRHGYCSAGGECGIPDAGKDTFDPIVHWSTCQVIDWLNGNVSKSVRTLMADIFAITRELVKIYGVIINRSVFEFADPEVEAGRFGCYGCPAIGGMHGAPKATVKRNGALSPLNELHDVMDEARMYKNRIYGGRIGRLAGPVKMAVRKILFARVMDIQKRSGVTILRPEDQRFIKACWRKKVYPRGWSEEDELTVRPEGPLFSGDAAN